MKKILLYIFIISSLALFSQDKSNSYRMKHNTIQLNSHISLESNNLNTNLLNTLLYGGYIDDEMKDNWINTGYKNNKLNSEFINGIRYIFKNKNNRYFYLQISDINNLSSNFTDDFLKLILYGNFNYQGDTLDFSNTSIRINRYQHYKFGYNFNIIKDKTNYNIGAALAYLSGNHYMQLNIDEGNLYTHEMGTSLDINYDIKTMMTDTSNFSPFTNNGNGVSLDFSLHINKEDNIIGVHMRDLGFIKWKKNSIINNTDSSFRFSGIEIEDFNNVTTFNDSILDITFSKQNNYFRSFIPSKITFSYNKILDHNILKNIWIATHTIWQPLYVEGGINTDLIYRGFKESVYDNSLEVISNLNIELINVNLGFRKSGISEKTNLILEISDNKEIIKVGTFHLNEFFNKDKNSSSLYFSLTARF